MLSQAENQIIERLVQSAKTARPDLELLLKNLVAALSADSELARQIHSMKWRVKDPDHLRDKLQRKLDDAKKGKEKFLITESNLFAKINDLAGLRLLHLHTTQFECIDQCLKRILAEHYYRVVEKPTARVWDDESRKYFKDIGIRCVSNDRMYTSVHYVVAPNRQTLYTCEIQVRTLAEELWGEVDHSMNYPHKTDSLSCREQIKVLARVTSSCSRLVDSIFLTHADHLAGRNVRKGK